MGAYTPGQAKEIPIGDFAPDLPMDTPGIILDAVGARPTIAGFRPLPNLSEFGDALPTKPLGSYLAYYSDETTKLFAATEAGLWRLNGTSWVEEVPFGGSGDFSGLAKSQGFFSLPAEGAPLAAGTLVDYLPWRRSS